MARSTECAVCGEPLTMPFKCNECSRVHCSEHQLPENHECKSLAIEHNGWVGIKSSYESRRTVAHSYRSRLKYLWRGMSSMNSKITGTFRALFSVWGFILLLILVGGGLALLYPDEVQDQLAFISDDFGGDIQRAEVENGTLNVTIADDHESDAVLLNHQDAEDYVLYESELGPFGETITIDLHDQVTCDDEEFPDGSFEIRLVSLEAGDGDLILYNITTDERESVDIPERFVTDTCGDNDGQDSDDGGIDLMMSQNAPGSLSGSGPTLSVRDSSRMPSVQRSCGSSARRQRAISGSRPGHRVRGAQRSAAAVGNNL